MTDPAVVCVGGGHGAAAALGAVRQFAGSVTAVISVADDGGSSGRLRAMLDVVGVGDLRRCLVALAEEPERWRGLFEHRFGAGELEGHPVGNLVLSGLVELHGDLLVALEQAARLMGCVGRVLPATAEPVVLEATTAVGTVLGQARITTTPGVERVRVRPSDPTVPLEVIDAISGADLIVLGPGSLYTSVLAAVAPPALTAAITEARGRLVYLANLRPQEPETAGYSVADHLDALDRHGIAPYLVVCDTSRGIELGAVDLEVLDVVLTNGRSLIHDATKLAAVLFPLAP